MKPECTGIWRYQVKYKDDMNQIIDAFVNKLKIKIKGYCCNIIIQFNFL